MAFIISGQQVLFDRPGIYGYYDDGERFAFFQQAVIELMQRISYIPDILHCNDYHTAFIPFLLREKYGWIEASSITLRPF